MEALRSSEEMLSKATQLWTMLDDMAENNPGSYRQFMQQQLKEAKQHYAPPEPRLCLKTCISVGQHSAEQQRRNIKGQIQFLLLAECQAFL